MKLNGKNLLLTAMLAIAGLFGTTTAVVSQKINGGSTTKMAEASHTGGDYSTIILDVSAATWWGSDCTPYVNYWGSSTRWLPMTKIGTSNYFWCKVTKNDRVDGMIFARGKNASVSSFDDCYNQTTNVTDLAYIGVAGYYKILNTQSGVPGCGNNNRQNWDRAYSTNNSLIAVSSVSQSPTATHRYWWKVGDSASSLLSGAYFVIHAWGGTTDKYYCPTAYENKSGDGNKFYYVDLPSDITKYQVVRCMAEASSNAPAFAYKYSNEQNITSNQWTYLNVIYSYWADNSAEMQVQKNAANNYTDNSYSGSNKAPSAYVIAEFLTDYPTCSMNSTIFNLIKTNWWDVKDDSYNGSVSSVSLWDYSYNEYKTSGYTSSMSRSESSALTAQDKWTALSNMVSSGNPNHATRDFSLIAINDNNFPTMIIIISSSIALMSIAALSIIVIKKRKETK